ncbi:RNA demethylase ALKBH5-like [Watersipora subatra]|uniref:RNA demethylase ALKBH5-like n=1 Tax=Watersipora subatra TaxID=2589382 RepID=UPI00355B1FA5
MDTLCSDTLTTTSDFKRAISRCKADASKDFNVPVIVISDSDKSSVESEEEDVCSIVMRFNRFTKPIINTRRTQNGNDKEILLVSDTSSVSRKVVNVDRGINFTPSASKSPRIPTRLQKRKLVSNLKSDKLNGCAEHANSAIDFSACGTSGLTQHRRSKIFRTEQDNGKQITKKPTSHHYETYDSFDECEGEEVDLVKSGIKQYRFFSNNDCSILEQMIDDQIVDKIDTFKPCTVDRAPLRNKYFFGEGYTYGSQMKRKGPGMEELYPKGFVDDIPEWIKKFVIQPLEKADILPKDWVNSCVINDYLSGGCIISHIDPKQLFDRPIFTISLMSDAALSFGVKFSFKPIRCSEPVYRVPLKRGCITSISGYAADNITHCVRPQDTKHRRAVIILRRVFDDAPRLPPDHQLPWKQEPDRHRRSAPVHGYYHFSQRYRQQDDDIIKHDSRYEKRSRRSAPAEDSYSSKRSRRNDPGISQRGDTKKHHRRSIRQ